MNVLIPVALATAITGHITDFQTNAAYDSHALIDMDSKELIIVYQGNPGSVCGRLHSDVHDYFIDIMVYNKNTTFKIRC